MEFSCYYNIGGIMHKKDGKKKKLAEFLEREKITTMHELKKVASTDVGMTVYRLLKKLSYLTSYSHNGK